jgi:hypothetical protein
VKITPNGGDNPCVCGFIHPCCRYLVDGGCPHSTPGDHHHAPNEARAWIPGLDCYLGERFPPSKSG